MKADDVFWGLLLALVMAMVSIPPDENTREHVQVVSR